MQTNFERYIYYGIICCFFYLKVMDILYKLVTTVLLSIHCNIYVLFAALVILLSCFVLYLFKKKKFKEIKIWHFICLIAIECILIMCNVPERFLTSRSLYSESERLSIGVASSYFHFCVTIILVIFSFYKYYTGRNKDKDVVLSNTDTTLSNQTIDLNQN